MGSHSLIQRIFLTHGLNLGHLHCRQILYDLSHQGSPPCFIVVQLLSRDWLFATPWTLALQDYLSFTVSQSLLKLMFTESVMPSNHLILCPPLLLLPPIFPSIRVFWNESALCIRWPKYWSFSLSIGPSRKYSGLISWRLIGLISLLSKGLSRVFSNTTVQKHQYFNIQPSLGSNSQIHTWLLEKPQVWLHGPLLAKQCLCFLICYLHLSWLFFQGASIF